MDVFSLVLIAQRNNHAQISTIVLYLMRLLIVLASYHQIHLILIEQMSSSMVWSSYILFALSYILTMITITILFIFIILTVNIFVDAIYEGYKKDSK